MNILENGFFNTFLTGMESWAPRKSERMKKLIIGRKVQAV